MQGTIAIVTGGGGNIGRGICQALAEAGASVVAIDLDPSGAEHAAMRIECDLTDAAACASTVDRVVAELGGIDTLVNAAQWIQVPTPFVELTEAELRRSMETGPIATFRMMQLCQAHLKVRGGGAIINFASGAGTDGGPGWGAYAAAKEAIRGLSKVASEEWGVDNIRVNVICPVAAGDPEATTWATDALRSRIPLRRIGDPCADIGSAVVYLAGPGSYVTGHTLMLDGGLGRFR
jgi:NAD(P)-dependent dehydrogenase (short-subunit alcohol dehydrogenase family)